MEIAALHKQFSGHPVLKMYHEHLSAERIFMPGLAGSSKTVIPSLICREEPVPHVFILPDREAAAYFYSDLVNMSNLPDVLFFPASWKQSVAQGRPDPSGLVMRTEVMHVLVQPGRHPVIITYPDALAEKMAGEQWLKQYSFTLNTGDIIPLSKLEEKLKEFMFVEVDFVTEPGQYAVRGGIIDVFSFSSETPVRIDFLGNEIDSIRSINPEDQLSKETLEQFTIAANVSACTTDESRIPFFRLLPGHAMLWSNCFAYAAEQIDKVREEIKDVTVLTDDLGREIPLCLMDGNTFLREIQSFRTVDLGHQPFTKPDLVLRSNTGPQPVFNKNFNLLADNLHQHIQKDYRIFLLSDNPNQVERLRTIFHDLDKEVRFTAISGTLHEGFIDHDLKVCLYTDHQVFDRYHRYRLRQMFTRKAVQNLKEVNDLKPGDYVVHVDHGIGIFGGLEMIINNNRPQEAIRLIYKDNDILYVSIHALHKISRYRGTDGSKPRISKLGTGAWQKMKERTKKKIKDIARDLIRLYASRKMEKGFAFSPDTYLQQELEASFMYEDTPDQLTATRAVKQGMEVSSPMDHLICGDVGFGKTEIAIRAAFKAVTDSKQVAVLVPTTILAMQHHSTFTERLNGFPCTVDYVSRLKKPSAVKESLKKLAEGKTDIIIGTHRLLGKDVKFRDLGLLIIDEEQKFGVAAKEKLKSLRVSVDTLTLTATPIPRTLQFSLMGARDLSVINTPPPNRHPIVTEIHTLNEKIIREGIEQEVARNGQVFFIHNRVNGIHEVENMIRKIVPHVKVTVAHGQMEGARLEKTMLEFIRGDYDVLVATTIIESGLDIPNVNTIFINNAQNYGLSDLHQLRGRVGRSNRKAYCYLLTPPLSTLTHEARQRLQAIEEFSDLGSGFFIALQDLDIRGAGNLLGAEQSGFIAEIGFETYQRILDEAIHELKEEEFRDVFAGEEKKVTEKDKTPVPVWVSDCMIDSDIEIRFPESYISNVTERMRLYREMDNITSEEQLMAFSGNLRDRFGPVPPQTLELMNVVRLRWLAQQMGFEKIILRNSQMILHFISNPVSPYFRSPVFASILEFVQRQPRRYRMKESTRKLTLTVTDIRSIDDALTILRQIQE